MSGRASIDRVRFDPGQRLDAADLRDAVGGELRRQEIHVVAAHRTWGIALGLRVRSSATGALVLPGVAFDALGRAIVVTRIDAAHVSEQLGKQPVLALVVSFDDGCAPRPRFVEPADVRPGLDVILARFGLTQGALGRADLTARKGASSLGPPRIGGGSMSIPVAITSATEPFTTTIDTSTAGFRDVPSYVVTPTIDDATVSTIANAGAIGPFVSVGAGDDHGFPLDVCVSRTQSGGSAVSLSFQLDVTWLGVEPFPRCEPISFTS